jgi:predicted 3-demethylubiquinone-9 3-methyltransferase (glyoxalase superfamily)
MGSNPLYIIIYRAPMNKTIMQKITPFLWFDNNAEEAAKYYTSIFKNSKIIDITDYGESAAEASGRLKGTVM